MRDYSKVSPRFWTGDTGRQIRTLGPEAQVIAFYLFTCPSANMLGLYYLALPTLCHETGSSLEGALKALRSLENIGFAYYDQESEHVYLPNMAREQIGESLKEKDNRAIAVRRELESLRKTPFFNDFVTRYRDAYHLQDIQLNKPLASPSEAPSKGLQRIFKEVATPLRSQEQEQEHEQAQEQESQENIVEFGSGQDLTLDLQGATPPPNPKAERRAAAERIFDHWRKTHEHDRAKIDDRRVKLIYRALDAGYTEADLCQAITGYLNSPHHMGENDRNTKYDSIELMLRGPKYIDQGLKFYAEPPRTERSKLMRRNIAATADWKPPELRHAAK